MIKKYKRASDLKSFALFFLYVNTPYINETALCKCSPGIFAISQYFLLKNFFEICSTINIIVF